MSYNLDAFSLFQNLPQQLCNLAANSLTHEEELSLCQRMKETAESLSLLPQNEKIGEICTQFIQSLEEQDCDFNSLSRWLINHSIKRSNGELEGAIKPFQGLFQQIIRCQSSNQETTLAFSNNHFSPTAFLYETCNLIAVNSHLENISNDAINLLQRWQNINNTEGVGPLFEDTEKFTKKLKKLSEQQLTDLRIIMEEKGRHLSWSKIATYVVDHSFSEFDGAYPILNHLISLIFNPFSIPEYFSPQNINPEKNVLQRIRENVDKSTFKFLLDFRDLRRQMFNDSTVLEKIALVSKNFKNISKLDLLDMLNRGVISNQILNLNTPLDLFRYFGSTCSEITRLDTNCKPQRKNSSSEEIPPYFPFNISEYLPKLTHLILDSCTLTPDSKRALEELQLKTLQLHYSSEGENSNIESSNFDFLATNPRLEWLDLSYFENTIDLQSLENLQNLMHLNLTSCNCKNSLPILKKLHELNLSSSSLSDSAFLNQLSSLTTLILNDSKITKLNIQNHDNIQVIQLTNNPHITEINLTDLSTIEKIEIQNCKSLKAISLKNLPELRELNIDSLEIDPNTLHDSKKIFSLRTKNSKLCSDCSWLSKLPLEVLDVSGSSINDANLKLVAKHPHLRELNVSGCFKFKNLKVLLESNSLKIIHIGKWKIDSVTQKKFAEKGIELVP